jgi:hypothetical protein
MSKVVFEDYDLTEARVAVGISPNVVAGLL